MDRTIRYDPIERGRLRSFAAAALVFVFLWMGFGTIFAGAPGASVFPTHGLRGSTVVLSGDILEPNESAFVGISIFWDWVDGNNVGQRLTNGKNNPFPDADGKFTFTFDVPLNSPDTQDVGPHTIHVCGQNTSTAGADPAGTVNCDFREFDVTYTIDKPTLTFNRNHGRAGEIRVAKGRGFQPYCNGCEQYPQVAITFDPNGEAVLLDPPGIFAQQDTTPQGKFDENWNVPVVPFNTYNVVACDLVEGCDSSDQDTAKFTVTRPKIFLNKSQGLPGSKVAVSGTGMYAKRTLRIYFGTNNFPHLQEFFFDVKPTKSTNANGAFGPFNITVPGLPPGPPGPKYRITACTVAPNSTTGECATVGDPNDPAFDPNDPSFDSPFRPFKILALPTPTPSPAITPEPTPTPSPEPTPEPTAEPTPSRTPRPTPEPPQPTPEPTPEPTVEPTEAPTASPEPSPTPEQPTPSPEPTVAPTAEPTLEPTLEPTAEPTPTPEVTAEPTATPEVTPTPEVTAEPTEAPNPSPVTGPVITTWPRHLNIPGAGIDLAPVAGSALLALLIAFLVPFPGTLFNKTVEANYPEIQGWLGRIQSGWRGFVRRVAVGPLRPVSAWFSQSMTGVLGVWVFLLLTALVYGFLSPDFGLNIESLALFLGLAVGLGFITAAFDLPLRVYHRRRSRDVGVLRALWWTLGVAVICVLVSRLAGFQPGYLYGLIISIVFVAEISTRDEGLGVWLASIWLLVLSFAAWVLLGVVRQAGGDPWVELFVETVLVTFVVAGVEAMVIGLLPMRFLPGHPLYRWRRSLWFPLFALSVFAYLLILVDPANGYLSDNSRTPTIVGVIFLVTFGVVSLGTWAYFRYRPKRPGLDKPGESPDLPSGTSSA